MEKLSPEVIDAFTRANWSMGIGLGFFAFIPFGVMLSFWAAKREWSPGVSVLIVMLGMGAFALGAGYVGNEYFWYRFNENFR